MEKLAAHRRRMRAIRRRVIGASVATFLAASGVVLVQLVTGNDPALGHGTATTGATADATRSAHRASVDARPSGRRPAVSPSAVTTSAS
jgi:hypothetical protein